VSKKIKIIIISLVLAATLAAGFSAGCIFGTATAPPASVKLEQDTVNQAWNIIFQDYVEKDKIDALKLSGGAIKGLITALNDPYSTYFDPETYKLSLSSLQGKFQGIGAFIGVKDKQLIITNPLPDSPAAKAGLKPGDVILAIDGLPTTDMSPEEAAVHVRGPSGTPVKLLVQHQGETNPVEISVVRAEITIPSVFSEVNQGIGYIEISQFAENTDSDLTKKLSELLSSNVTGLIIDLRGNPGGLLDTVVSVASHFIKDGVIVSEVDNRGNKTSLSAVAQNVFTNLPMVVLTDNFSASGSEVLSGALQDYQRATIAGTVTYGKGSYDYLNPLKDGSALYLTTGRWLTPKGRLIEGKGITPDIKLDLQGDAEVQWAIDYLKGKQ
jgi:carboxyl-terminal processing protease